MYLFKVRKRSDESDFCWHICLMFVSKCKQQKHLFKRRLRTQCGKKFVARRSQTNESGLTGTKCTSFSDRE